MTLSTSKPLNDDPMVLKVLPFSKPLQGEVEVPGSKSISNRALVLSVLAKGSCTLQQCLWSEDTVVMMHALTTLGFDVSANESEHCVHIQGLGGVLPTLNATIDVKNSGTSARFLTALCTLAPQGVYHFDGSPAMRKRPQAGLLKALQQQGARFEFHQEAMHMPFTMYSSGLSGGIVEVDARASSQFISALLMVAPYAKSSMKIVLNHTHIRRAYIDLTIGMMQDFSDQDPLRIESSSQYYQTHIGNYQAPFQDYIIEGDLSAASYFMALPLVVGGSVLIKNIQAQSRQGDLQWIKHLIKSGLQATWQDQGLLCSFDLTHVKPKSIQGDFYAYSDTFLTAAALAPCLQGETILTGLAHTRWQECDRLAVMAANLKRIGQDVDEEEAELHVTPNLLKSAMIETAHDHRVAMSFGILGCKDIHGNGEPWLSIKNPLCCEKTFPLFFDVLSQLHTSSH
jgi:3-phosphoshikimate 1-carboxyvinyltransferase